MTLLSLLHVVGYAVLGYCVLTLWAGPEPKGATPLKRAAYTLRNFTVLFWLLLTLGVLLSSVK